MSYHLIIGNRNYSSWSMRAWLMLRLTGAEFTETVLPLYEPGSRARVEALGGETGLVPVLVVNGLPVWDTLAITETLAERYPGLWPTDDGDRARARSYTGEVHAGLNALREAMPVNTRGRGRQAHVTPAVQEDIDRVCAIWAQAGQADTPWLFGDFCVADAFFAPVATRFRTYEVDVPDNARPYRDALLAHPWVVDWCALGAQESGIISLSELPPLAGRSHQRC